MGMKYAEKPFNMGMLFYPRRPSKLVHIQTLNTHIRAFLYRSRPPPPRGNWAHGRCVVRGAQISRIFDIGGRARNNGIRSTKEAV